MKKFVGSLTFAAAMLFASQAMATIQEHTHVCTLSAHWKMHGIRFFFGNYRWEAHNAELSCMSKTGLTDSLRVDITLGGKLLECGVACGHGDVITRSLSFNTSGDIYSVLGTYDVVFGGLTAGIGANTSISGKSKAGAAVNMDLSLSGGIDIHGGISTMTVSLATEDAQPHHHCHRQHCQQQRGQQHQAVDENEAEL